MGSKATCQPLPSCAAHPSSAPAPMAGSAVHVHGLPGMLPIWLCSLPLCVLACRRVSARPPLGHSSRRLLGASFATLSHKWEPRFSAAPSPGAPPPEDWEAAATSDASDLEAPLLSPSLSATAASPRAPRRGSSLQRGGTASGRLSGGSEGEGSVAPSRSASVDRQLDKWGSREFADESPFWPAAAASSKVRGTGAWCWHLAACIGL